MAKQKYWDGANWIQTAPSMDEFINSGVHYGDDTGTANAKVVTIPGITSYKKGMAIAFVNKDDNTGTFGTTINVNGLGAKPIYGLDGNSPKAGFFKSGYPFTVRYSGSFFFLQGEGGGYKIGDEISNLIKSTDAEMPISGTDSQITNSGSHFILMDSKLPYGYIGSVTGIEKVYKSFGGRIVMANPDLRCTGIVNSHDNSGIIVSTWSKLYKLNQDLGVIWSVTMPTTVDKILVDPFTGDIFVFLADNFVHKYNKNGTFILSKNLTQRSHGTAGGFITEDRIIFSYYLNEYKCYDKNLNAQIWNFAIQKNGGVKLLPNGKFVALNSSSAVLDLRSVSTGALIKQRDISFSGSALDVTDDGYIIVTGKHSNQTTNDFKLYDPFLSFLNQAFLPFFTSEYAAIGTDGTYILASQYSNGRVSCTLVRPKFKIT